MSPSTAHTLESRVILVTRPADQAATLVKYLDQRGARAITAPAIEIGPLRSAVLTRALRDLAHGEYCLDHVDQPGHRRRPLVETPRTRGRPSEGGGDRRRHRRCVRRVGGPGGRPAPRRLHHCGTRPGIPERRGAGPVCARRYRSRGIRGRTRGRRVGLRSASTPTVRSYPGHCRRRRARRSGRARSTPSRSRAHRPCEDSSGRSGPVRGAPRVVCIGPVTAAAAREHGLTVHAVARPHTVEGVVKALERLFAGSADR